MHRAIQRPAALAVDAGSGLVTLDRIERRPLQRQATGIEEFDRVLGGGIVPGAVVLLGVDPGTGKSTLLLQALARLESAGAGPALYVTGEESAEQVALRAERLGLAGLPLPLLPEIQLERVLAAACARAARDGDRLHPDDVHRGAHLRAGVGGAGARMRGPAHALRQGEAARRCCSWGT